MPPHTTTLLVTGGDGQVGRALQQHDWPETIHLVATTRAELDITDRRAVDDTVEQVRPDVIVNAAAYTAVDAAEDDPDGARLVNATAVANLAAAADRHGAGLIHLSTDYVFDGGPGGRSESGWYVEADLASPVNHYGATKLAGEAVALEADRAVVLRTSGVYSPDGANFVKTMRRLAGGDQPIRVVADQHVCPTAAADIAAVVAAVVARDLEHTGLFHAASSEGATWHELAGEAIRLAGGANPPAPITTADYPVRATRPVDVRLSCAALTEAYGVTCPSWRESLVLVSKRLDDASTRVADLEKGFIR